MALDFKKLINQELNRGNMQEQDKHDSDRIDINSKNSFFGRVLPLGEDEFPAVTYAEAWVDYKNRDGKQSVTKVTLDLEDRDDKLTKLLLDVVRYNRSYNKEHQENGGKDKIVINHKNSRFPFRVNYRAEFVGIPMAKNRQTGAYELKLNSQTGYQFNNYSVSYAAYKSMLKLTQDDTVQINGAPFPTALGYITKDETYPITIQLPRGGTGYEVKFSTIPLPAITFDYLKRKDDGDFAYFDDPNIHIKSTKEANPSLYEEIYRQLKASVEAQESQDQDSQVNPYLQGQPQPQPQPQTQPAPQAPRASAAPTPVAPQSAQAPVQPTKAPSDSAAPQPANSQDVVPQAPQPQHSSVTPQPVSPAQGTVQPSPQPSPAPQQDSEQKTSLDDIVNDDNIFEDDSFSIDDSDDLPF